jgi:hypothetical protein
VRWRLIDLCQWLWEEFRVSVAGQTLGRELRSLGYRKLSHAIMPRPRERSSILKSFPAVLAEIARDKGVEPAAIEVWFADEARVGQKNKISRRWARRGTRPAAPTDQRTASTYIFGAICPALGKGAALVLPHCNTVFGFRSADGRFPAGLVCRHAKLCRSAFDNPCNDTP